MKCSESQLLLCPTAEELRFLPEGPYPVRDGFLSWLAIQHGAHATNGSLNILDLMTCENRSLELDGRPGFAFATDHEGVFIVGLERRLVLVNFETGSQTVLCEGIEADVENTIINDGVVIDGGLVFGCKDLEFSSRKAGLYLFRSRDCRLIQLRNDQICSNGKVVHRSAAGEWLLDIDSPTKTVVRYALDVDQGCLGDPEVVLDLTEGNSFPDGMIATPDEQGVIIAFYNPEHADAGEVCQFRLADGQQEHVWKTPGSPQATCPQLIKTSDGVRLVITTAVEHMTRERRDQAPHAGCLFIADTGFESTPETPQFQVPEGVEIP